MATSRRYDIDWLRIAAVLFLIPFHSARVFDIWDPFYVKNPALSPALSHAVIATIAPWQMPLLFVLAGASTYYALGFRSSGQYLGERLKRLFFPLIFGLLLIVPPQGYFARLDHGTAPSSIWQFYSSYFTTDPGDMTGYTGNWTPAHLWFIMFLFLFSIIVLPLFRMFRRSGGKRLTARLAATCRFPGIIFLWFLPVFFVGNLTGGPGGTNFFYYLVLFVVGYLLFAHEGFQEAIDRNRTAALILGITALAGDFTVGEWLNGFPAGTWQSVARDALDTFVTWTLVLAILGYGRRWLNRDHRLLPYLGEAAYPFYILHQTVIVAIAYYVVSWDLPLFGKYAVIALLSLAVTWGIYELAVRRIKPMRFLFGMKPRRRRKT